MDFSRTHINDESVAFKSKVRYIPTNTFSSSGPKTLDDQVLEAANLAARDMLLGSVEHQGSPFVDASLYLERSFPQSEIISAGDLVVIFESFDNLNFVYAKSKDIFSNRNGHFHHDDFLGKPFGCKIRSRTNRGYGYCYLLKPTPELWARSLNHRTQIVHELDASMICFYLNLRPNMVVCETGTGSGAMSHGIMRAIAPHGTLHTYEFNARRAEQARQEFEKNGLSNLVVVYHKDVCGKAPVVAEEGEPKQSSSTAVQGGFGLQGQSVDAIFLDLPEPWLAVPHAAFSLKPTGRIASYSPCVEQSQQTIAAMKKAGFHTLKTVEFRLRENYVGEWDSELPPREKRPKIDPSPYGVGNEVKEEGGIASAPRNGEEAQVSKTHLSQATAEESSAPPEPAAAPQAYTPLVLSTASSTCKDDQKCNKVLVARPFVNMRGHTAFLTFATAGNIAQPDPNKACASQTASTV